MRFPHLTAIVSEFVFQFAEFSNKMPINMLRTVNADINTYKEKRAIPENPVSSRKSPIRLVISSQSVPQKIGVKHVNNYILVLSFCESVTEVLIETHNGFLTETHFVILIETHDNNP